MFQGGVGKNTLAQYISIVISC